MQAENGKEDADIKINKTMQYKYYVLK